MLRLIEQVPISLIGTSGQNAVWFGDVARQRHSYGGAAVDSIDDFLALSIEQRNRLNRAFSAIPIASHAGAFIGEAYGWRAAIGFDFWQIDHTIAVGPASNFSTFSHLVGRLNPAIIRTRLGEIGYRPRAYRGVEVLDRENIAAALSVPDADDFIFQSRSVTARNGALIAALSEDGVEAAIDLATASPRDRIADPDYAVLAVAFNSMIGAVFLPAAPLYRPVVAGPGTPTTRPVSSTPPYATTLPEYRLAGFAL